MAPFLYEVLDTSAPRRINFRPARMPQLSPSLSPQSRPNYALQNFDRMPNKTHREASPTGRKFGRSISQVKELAPAPV